MPRTARAPGAIALVALLLAGVFAVPADAKRIRGTIDEGRFSDPRPTTSFVLQIKGKRARFTQLGLALECTPDDDKDPRLLVDVRTPWRRIKYVLGEPGYSFDGTVRSSAGAIRLKVTLGYTKPFVGGFEARMGNCSDGYVDMKRGG